ncbi:MAG TPA: DUF5689 domain-containing protein [Chitinophagaceae bacterium]|jgi:hypothetical protein|nr:DUF5689 domain-containing protein [Chitinophagaceae bacterium]
MRLNKFKNSAIAFLAFALLSIVSVSCDKQPIGPTGPDPIGPSAGQYITLKDFRALYTGSGTYTIPTGTKKFRAQVISNPSNEASSNVRLQDESGFGIRMFTAIGSQVYTQGTVLEVDATGGGRLELYNGDLELSGVPAAKVVPQSGSIPLATRSATIADIITNKSLWSSSLVKITSVTITQGSTNPTGTNYTLTDATGSLTTFVRTASGITVALGSNKTVTGYVSIFNSDAELIIRSATDIQ